MSFFSKFFGRKKEEQNVEDEEYIVANFNDKVMPFDRGEVYEDPLDEFLKSEGIGEVSGGGTMQLETGEIEYCDVEIKLNPNQSGDDKIELIIAKLEDLGAPKGSFITIEKTSRKIELGKREGIGIYLDGVNLGDDVYQNNDSNFVVSEVKRLINDNSEAVRYWEAEKETGLYFYADSFIAIEASIQGFLSEYPLCKNARVEQIA